MRNWQRQGGASPLGKITLCSAVSSRHDRRRMRLSTPLLVAVVALAAAPAFAQSFDGTPLQPIQQIRGPFQTVVVGGGVVDQNGAPVDPSDAQVTLQNGAAAAEG